MRHAQVNGCVRTPAVRKHTRTHARTHTHTCFTPGTGGGALASVRASQWMCRCTGGSHTCTRTPTLTHTHTHVVVSLSICLSLCVSLSHTQSHTLTHAHIHTRTLSLSLSHTHTHTHTHQTLIPLRSKHLTPHSRNDFVHNQPSVSNTSRGAPGSAFSHFLCRHFLSSLMMFLHDIPARGLTRERSWTEKHLTQHTLRGGSRVHPSPCRGRVTTFHPAQGIQGCPPLKRIQGLS